jgi:phosphomannomutase
MEVKPMVNPAIFKAYDIRGVYPSELDEDTAYRIGRSIVAYLQVNQVVVGRDMRVSSPQVAQAVMRGITDQGADVVDLNLTTTDELYFAVGKFGYPAGVMVTASHNPAQYNGMKICRDQARALSADSGLMQIRDLAISGDFPTPARKGEITTRDITDAYVEHVLSFIDVSAIRPLKVAIDAGNGMAGLIAPKVFAHLPCEIVPLYFELDGRFPNHQASPMEPENIADLQRAVREQHTDLGGAFDGDADRMFIVDEHAQVIGGDIVTALVSLSLLRKHPGSTILYNAICSRSVPELIERAGGQAIRTRVGHSFIKAQMREVGAIFAGEHSGHFYYRDNWYADSGLIAFLIVLELISTEGKTVSELVAPLDTRFRSGEINFRVKDIPGKLQEVEDYYADAQIDHLDGLTVSYPAWWFNLRPSNTEGLLRLNLEGDTRELMAEKRDEVVQLIRG